MYENVTIFTVHWIDLRENLQETMVFPKKYWGVPDNLPLNQSNDEKKLSN